MLVKWESRTSTDLVLGSAPKDGNGVIYTIVRMAMLLDDYEGVRLLHQITEGDTVKWKAKVRLEDPGYTGINIGTLWWHISR